MKKIILIVGALVVLLGGGGGAYFFLFAKKAEHVEEAPKPPPTPVFLALEPLSVPLPRKGKPPIYYYITMNLQTTDAGKARMYEIMPKLRDAYLRELNSNPVARRDNPEEIDLELLKQRVLKITKSMVGDDAVSDALVTRNVRGAG